MNAHDILITLIRVGQEDEYIGRFLRSVARLDDFQRQSLINGMIAEMTLKGAPADFINAIAALRKPEIAAALREWFEQQE